MKSLFARFRVLGHALDSFWHRNRCLLNVRGYWRYRKWKQQQCWVLAAGKPLVIFDFSDSLIDGPQGRRFYTLFMFFVRAGYFPVLVDNYRFLSTIKKRHKAFCLDESFALFPAKRKTHLPYVLVTDFARPRLFTKHVNGEQKVVQLDFRSDYSPAEEGFPMPFPMFSGIYRSGQDSDALLSNLRKQKRDWSVFFGGDAASGKYSKNTIVDIYKKIPRAIALACLRKNLPSEFWVEPKSQPELEANMQSGVDGVLCVSTRYCKLAVHDWLNTVARTRFFLALPGVRYPMSHNLIEAMAVGTVPITEYPELFFPSLQHGKNCLVYSSEQSLVEVVQQAIVMTEGEWAELASGAVEYYQQYLHPVTTIERLLHGENKVVRLRLLPFLKAGGGFA